MNNFKFEILYQSKKSKARVGRIYTAHGIINTPNFVAVGTNGTVKALDNKMLKTLNLELMFCNTYHLLLQPGVEIIKKAKGLHAFINRDLPIITDSGGFQVFSLAYGGVKEELKSKGKKREKNLVLKISEEGVLFRSYINGKKIFLTPEKSVEIQKDLAADIIVPFDEVLPYHVEKKYLKDSLERTHRWEKRSLEYHMKNKKDQAMFGIVHGSTYEDLRKKSAIYIDSLGFDGFAIGGSFGRTQKDMLSMLSHTTKFLDYKKPVHLLGIGDVLSLKKSILFGIDTFDSSYPTKAARHGLLLKKDKNLKINKMENKDKFFPIEKGCKCFTCSHYNISYLHHLFKAKELIFYTLATIHNLFFMINLMKDYRKKILDGEI